MKNTIYLLGFLCGVAAVAVIAFVVGFVMRKKGKKACRYDERQEAIQGRAYKAAFVTLAVYELVCGFFDLCTGLVWCDRIVGAFIGVAIALAVFGVSGILSDAYFRNGENQGLFAALFAFVSVVNIGFGIWKIIDGEFVVDGVLTHHCLNMVVGLMFVPMLIAMLVKRVRDKRETETE